MKTPLPIAYSAVEENGFSFHMRRHAKKLSMNRIARLWWIARNSPYLAIKGNGKYMTNELSLIKKANGLNISDDTLKKDVELLRSAGVLIDVVTNDKYLLLAEFKKRHKDIIDKLTSV